MANSRDQYRVQYPFNNLDAHEVSDLANIIQEMLTVERDLEEFSHGEIFAFDEILSALVFLRREKSVNFRSANFLDCLGRCGSLSFYALVMGFDSVQSIEVSEESCLMAKAVGNAWKARRGTRAKIALQVGSMQDYFRFDADVASINCSIVGDSMLDEGILLALFFDLCRKLNPGTWLIVITNELNLSTEDCVSMGYDFLESVYHKNFPDITPTASDSEIGYGRMPRRKNNRASKLWILKTMNKV